MRAGNLGVDQPDELAGIGSFRSKTVNVVKGAGKSTISSGATVAKAVATDSDTKKMGFGTLAVLGIAGFALYRISKGSYK